VPSAATKQPAVPAPAPERRAWVEHAFAALGEAGYRAGGARTAVVEAIGREGGCLSAEEVSERVRAAGKRVGTASIYRALSVLTEVGVLHGVSMPGAPLRYELVLAGGHHHHHIVCERCGKTVSFQDPGLEAAIERLSERVAYEVGAHDVTLRGTCPACSRS
jgi:Fur family transcriptional regulator, ferric uptake regulator